MNYLIISLASGYGGSERTIELIAEELAQENQVTILAENDEHIERLTARKLNVINAEKGNSFSATFENCQHVVKNAVSSDVIITNTNKSAFILALSRLLLTKINKRKSIIFVRDYQWKYKLIIRFLLRGSKFCVASRAVEKYVNDNFGTHPFIIPNPIETLHDNSENDKKYNTIMCPAMISRWKGIEHLIAAMSMLPRHYKLKVIGKIADENYFNELQEQVVQLNLSDSIQFLPFEKDIAKYYQTCDVVVNTSVSQFGGPETFGRTIIEAWQYAKPAIAFSCGGPKFLINNGSDGLLVEEGNNVALAESILSLLEDDTKRKSMGIAGLKRAQYEFSLDEITRILNDVIAA
ncbi:glycosyltransferase family 4 protein [Kluyvera ascorbata]|uniref:glycosyltransferase family 4 protein n=1 Tax=Kluyvera ascorbata TaxID=51288 RepID=UPI0022E362DA|nr:glycosyltransferase family 4 protein [Kluyvera ascorbata]HDG1675753.1 glycosyltransferase family 4 protein [Kluyvera ascorbata]